MKVRVWPGPACGCVTAPASKSVAHRALIAAALSEGKSAVFGVGSSADIGATIAALTALGAVITPAKEGLEVIGVDPRRWQGGEVFCGESGSTLRFLLPVFALSGAKTRFTGAGRLLSRPQTVYADLFEKMGLPFSQQADGITFQGPLKAGEYTLAGNVSSQFFTGLLLALSLAEGDSQIHILPPFESKSYLRMTLQTLQDAGVHAALTGNTLKIPGGASYRPVRLTVEGDYSAAAFFALLGALTGRVECRGLSPVTGQGDAVIFKYLAAIGALVTPPEQRADPAKAGFVTSRSALKGGVLDLADCPDLGPVLMAAGCFCENGLTLQNTARLKYKESDRAAVMQQELGKLGFLCEVGENEIFLPGARTMAYQAQYEVSAHNDHRIAMALAVAAAALDAPVVIDQAESVEKSYPDFWRHLAAVGIRTEEVE